MPNRKIAVFPIIAALALLAAAACTSWDIGFLKNFERPTYDQSFPWAHIDLMPIWHGTRLTLQRRDPYTAEATAAIQTDYYGRPLTASELAGRVNPMSYAYPPHTALVFAPVTLIPWKFASAAFLLLLAIATAASVPLWVRVLRLQISRRGLAIYTAAVLVSWPALWGMRIENASLLVIPLIALGCFFLERERPVIAGFIFAVTTIKPQLVIILLPWLLLRSMLRREWRFPLTFAAVLGLMLLTVHLVIPGCIPDWLQAVRAYVPAEQVSPLLPEPLEALAAAACLVQLWRMRSASIGPGIAFAAATTFLLIPASWPTSYNALLLVPACLLVLEAPDVPALARRVVTIIVTLEYIFPLLAPALIPALSSSLLIAFAIATLAARNVLLPLGVTGALAAYCITRPVYPERNLSTARVPVNSTLN